MFTLLLAQVWLCTIIISFANKAILVFTLTEVTKECIAFLLLIASIYFIRSLPVLLGQDVPRRD